MGVSSCPSFLVRNCRDSCELPPRRARALSSVVSRVALLCFAVPLSHQYSESPRAYHFTDRRRCHPSDFAETTPSGQPAGKVRSSLAGDYTFLVMSDARLASLSAWCAASWAACGDSVCFSCVVSLWSRGFADLRFIDSSVSSRCAELGLATEISELLHGRLPNAGSCMRTWTRPSGRTGTRCWPSRFRGTCR